MYEYTNSRGTRCFVVGYKCKNNPNYKIHELVVLSINKDFIQKSIYFRSFPTSVEAKKLNYNMEKFERRDCTSPIYVPGNMRGNPPEKLRLSKTTIDRGTVSGLTEEQKIKIVELYHKRNGTKVPKKILNMFLAQYK